MKRDGRYVPIVDLEVDLELTTFGQDISSHV